MSCCLPKPGEMFQSYALRRLLPQAVSEESCNPKGPGGSAGPAESKSAKTGTEVL